MTRWFSPQRLASWMAALAIAALLAAPLWMTALSRMHEGPSWQRDPRPQFWFAGRGSASVDHIPAKIARMSGGAMWSGDGGAVVPLRPFVVRVTSRGWNLLVASEPWSSAWRVYWNGQRLPPVRVNGAFVGTFVPPGNATVELRYRPAALDDGLRLALAGIVLLAVTLRWRWYLWLAKPQAVLWLLFVGYGAFVISHRVDVAGGADSSGYLNQARLWCEGHLILPLPPELSEARIPLGFVPGARPGTMVPSYPPGVPLMMAGLRLAGGETAPFFLAPLMAIGSVWLFYRLARDLDLPAGWAACGAAILALCPVFVFHAIQVMSDDVATFWALSAMTCAFRGAKDSRFALLAGACLGFGVLVRPTQLLLLPAIVLALGLRRRPLLALVLGGLPFALAQLAVSHHLFGHALTTGYGTVLGDLRWRYFPARFAHYSFWLGAILSPLVFPLGFLGFRKRAVLTLWFAPFFLFYCFYQPYEEWWYTRFLLPAIPALILGALFVLRRWPIAVTLAIFALQVGFTWKYDLVTYARGERTYRAAARIVSERVPPDAIVLAMQESGALFYYTQRLPLRYDQITPSQFATLRASAYALVGRWEVEELRAHTGADWVVEGGVGDVVLLRRYLP